MLIVLASGLFFRKMNKIATKQNKPMPTALIAGVLLHSLLRSVAGTTDIENTAKIDVKMFMTLAPGRRRAKRRACPSVRRGPGQPPLGLKVDNMC